jgi:hypothetical protein
MAADKSNESVTQVDTYDYFLNTKTKSFVFGIPFINVVNSTGKTYSFTNVDDTKSDYTTTSNYGVFFKSQRGRLATSHTNRAKVYKTGVAKTTFMGSSEVIIDNLSELE